jgi:uncharacterized repeat protein (TIGR04052 family)
MPRFLLSRGVAAILALSILAACSSDEAPSSEHGDPESVKLIDVASGAELPLPYQLPSGATTRVEVQFFDADGELINDAIATDHSTELVFTPGTFATQADVTGERFQRDVTVASAVGTTASVTIGYGHGTATDERIFGPYDVAATAGAVAPFTLSFRAKVGAQPFSCTATYAGIGTTASTIAPRDFKMYVSDIRLLTAGGAEVPMQLTQDGTWQLENLALVDFEDQTGSCTNGTAQVRTVVEGSAPAGVYSGVKFVLGVPFARNHADASTAPSPLNLSSMFWSWNGGYKFLRADFSSTGQPGGFNIHLGSTGCNGATATTPPTSCTAPNRPEFTLQLNPATEVIVADLASLVAATNVDINQATTSPGCMSAPTDADCNEIFPRLSLAIGGIPAATQNFFRVEPR